MNIDDMKLGDIKKIASMFGGSENTGGLNKMIGQKCIVRTFSAGSWFGEVSEKSGKEIILCNARRLWQWCAKKEISLSAVSLYGLKEDKSKIVAPVDRVWLEAIEIIPCTDEAIKSIEDCENAKAQ